MASQPARPPAYISLYFGHNLKWLSYDQEEGYHGTYVHILHQIQISLMTDD